MYRAGQNQANNADAEAMHAFLKICSVTLIRPLLHQSFPDPSPSSFSPALPSVAASPLVYAGTSWQLPPCPSVDLPIDPPAIHDGLCDT